MPFVEVEGVRVSYRVDEAATKLLYLVLREVVGEWKMPPREWCEQKHSSPSCSKTGSCKHEGSTGPDTTFLTVPFSPLYTRRDRHGLWNLFF